VDPDHEWLLLEAGALALAWSGSSLGPRALKESNGEPFQELSLATSLLGWLAWETEIDVTAALERTRPIDLEEEDDPWYAVQVFASVAGQLARDAEALEVLAHAVARTARRGFDGVSWVSRHLRLAERIADIFESPQAVATPKRRARPGDLVVLGPTVDPRVRVALTVVPSGPLDKIGVLDLEDKDGKRQFLTSHVKYVAWSEHDEPSRRIARV
jgi:hypothetical protein